MDLLQGLRVIRSPHFRGDERLVAPTFEQPLTRVSRFAGNRLVTGLFVFALWMMALLITLGHIVLVWPIAGLCARSRPICLGGDRVV